MIIVIRMSGLTGTRAKQEATLETLMLIKKYNCVLLTKEDLPRIASVREMLTFGEVSDETLKLVLSKRGKKGKEPIKNVDEIIKGLNSGKTLRELGVKPYLRLHPPIGGFKKSTRLPYPQGVLGHNKEIETLVKKML